MKRIFILSTSVLLLLMAGCPVQRTIKPKPSAKTVKVTRHSDLPITFNAKTRYKETHRFLAILNRYRRQKGLRPLSVDEKLQRAAQWMSDDMAAKNYLSHHDSKGRDPFERMAAFGYGYNTDKAENVAAGQKTAEEVLKAWQSSSGHNRNMLDANFTAIGIGFSYGTKSRYGWYWATSYGGLKSR